MGLSCWFRGHQYPKRKGYYWYYKMSAAEQRREMQCERCHKEAPICMYREPYCHCRTSKATFFVHSAEGTPVMEGAPPEVMKELQESVDKLLETIRKK